MERAKALRRGQTDAEKRLWSRLRAAQLGVKFRRQHPLDGYITDFCCVERSLIIELDGGQHIEGHRYDEWRTLALEALGFRVIRFWNDDVLLRADDVVGAIVHALNEPTPPHPNPLPHDNRGRGSKASLRRKKSPALEELSALQMRARLYALIRQFFARRRVLEVETPILSAAGNTDPNIEGFSTRFNGHVDAGRRERFLRTSPEYPLKRLLASSVGDCYELGRVFRDGEAGRSHNPEFTMLEWYRVGWDHQLLMDECAELVVMALGLVGRTIEIIKSSYINWFKQELDLDPNTHNTAKLQAPLADFDIDPQGLTRDDWLDLLITHRLQPALPRDRITLVYDYPASQCALAKIRPGNPSVAERFELYVGSRELANGYHELNEASEQRARFERDNARRRERGQRELPIDENLLAVLDAMPDCAGVALGVDRLLMCMLDADDIRDVLAFPFADA